MSTPSARALAIADRLEGVVVLDLEVTAASWIAPELRELRLAGDLSGFVPWPGQDVMVSVARASGDDAWRRYTVAALEPAAIVLWVTTATDGPGAAWARRAQPGDRAELVGPRGKIALRPDASAHVFVVDEAGLAAARAMASAVEAPAAVHLVMPHDDHEALRPPVAAGVTIATSRLPSTGPTACDAGALRRLLAEATARLDGNGGGGVAGYVFGELHLTREVRAILEELGVRDDRLAVKAYWRADRANQDHGEPDRN